MIVKMFTLFMNFTFILKYKFAFLYGNLYGKRKEYLILYGVH